MLKGNERIHLINKHETKALVSFTMRNSLSN